MLECMKANILFHRLLKRPRIQKAYKMVPPSDSWYDTITTVHNSLAEIRKLPHEDVEITSRDGLRLRGIFYPGSSGKTMLWMHGYTSHAERESAFPALFYHSLGFNVLIPYLRAHGPSQGKFLSLGALESRDLQQWVQKINEKIPQGQILIHGLSMGGAVALFACDKVMENVKCIVADAPSTAIEDVFHNVARSVFKQEGAQVAEYAITRFQKEFGVRAGDFNAFEMVKNSRYPIFLTAGGNEHMEETLERLKAANPMETQVLILPGCNHGNGMYKQTELYQGALKTFIGRYMPECIL